jgi:hypothetical protein
MGDQLAQAARQIQLHMAEFFADFIAALTYTGWCIRLIIKDVYNTIGHPSKVAQVLNTCAADIGFIVRWRS